MAYKVDFTNAAERDLLTLPLRMRQRLDARILALADQPRPDGVVKLKATKGDLWRVRVGAFRAMAVLMGWMLVECISDESLTAFERLRWELLLVVGGPVTAWFFLKNRTFSPIGAAPMNQESKVD